MIPMLEDALFFNTLIQKQVKRLSRTLTFLNNFIYLKVLLHIMHFFCFTLFISLIYYWSMVYLQPPVSFRYIAVIQLYIVCICITLYVSLYNWLYRLSLYNHTVCICIHICIYIFFFFQILFPYRLLQNIEYSSLCYTVGSCCLSILYLKVYIC